MTFLILNIEIFLNCKYNNQEEEYLVLNEQSYCNIYIQFSRRISDPVKRITLVWEIHNQSGESSLKKSDLSIISD